MADTAADLPLVLTDGERTSSLWSRLEEHLKQQLENCRGKNDGDLDPVKTANMRGRIEILRELINLGKE